MERINELVEYLNARNKEYDEGHPTISDEEYDNKYFELIQLEKENNYYLINSPTQYINYQVVNSLNKVIHNHEMLSLNKTKDYSEVENFLGEADYIVMLKLDGLTCSLRYLNGRLISAETRGNGIEGEDILHNAMVIPSIPKTIAYKDELIIDGEIICLNSDFDSYSSLYKNSRNFAAGSIRLLDARECAKRKLTFVAWDIIKGLEEINSLKQKLEIISTPKFGFKIVPYGDYNYLRDIVENGDYPCDGLVFKYDNIEYYKSLGSTSHHPRGAIAYKFYDEVYETKLINIEWNVGRTGQITPVAIFEPVEIEGSTCERASLHNISVMRELSGGLEMVGDTLGVFKANLIIPQVSTWKRNHRVDEILTIPIKCPICGKPTEISTNDNVQILMCNNPDCEGKLINKLVHFCSKKGLDIKGLSKATLEKLIDWEWVNSLSDIMELKAHRKEWMTKPGFGLKSVDNILDAIEAAKNTTLDKFISSLGIPLIGETVSKDLVNHISSYEELREKVNSKFNFSVYAGFAESKTEALWSFDFTEADKIYNYLSIIKNEQTIKNEGKCDGLKFVITGKLTINKNRDALKKLIESNGGKVVDSISKNTNYLINNDINSTSSKNTQAKKLNIPIISENEFMEKFI